MIDLDTFLTTLYVMADDFCQAHFFTAKPTPGPMASLQCSEVITLALFGQWVQFPSERAFYRYAQQHLRAAFPQLPNRSQFNRLMRQYRDAITAFDLHLVELMQAREVLYEVLDSTAAVTRDAKRRGSGWLAGQADIGWSNRIGWYEGFHLLLSVTPLGVITGFGFGSASTHDQHLAATLFAARARPSSHLPSAGLPAHGSYVADKGFAGEQPRRQWLHQHQVDLVTPPHQRSKRIHWPKALRRWLAGLREIIETVNDKLLNTFRLARERPHDLTGFQARLAAKVGLHNFCIWLNLHLGRAPLAFADLIAW
jgi:DDE family transposase